MIEVERISEDRLTIEIWRFRPRAALSGLHLQLEFYGRSTRPSTRHKFKYEPKNRFCRDDQRGYNSGIAVDNVPLPYEICAEAVSKVEIIVMDAAGRITDAGRAALNGRET